MDSQGHVRNLLGDRFVRDFAGLEHNRRQDGLGGVRRCAAQVFPAWIDLLIPDPQARDAVLIADGKGATRTIVSGMRFTFPQWSPKHDQLSMWGTFQPSHIAMTDMAGGLGLAVVIPRPSSMPQPARFAGWRSMVTNGKLATTTS